MRIFSRLSKIKVTWMLNFLFLEAKNEYIYHLRI